MLTIASTRVSDAELDLRAIQIAQEIRDARGATADGRATLAVVFPPDIAASTMERVASEAKPYFESRDGIHDARFFQGPGFLALDMATALDDLALRRHLQDFVAMRAPLAEIHPDVWEPAIVRDVDDTRAVLARVAGYRYSYRDLDVFSQRIERYLRSLPTVSKVVRSGVVPEQIHVDYSRARLAAYGLDVGKLRDLVGARNITGRGGAIDLEGKTVTVVPTGQLQRSEELGGIVVGTTGRGEPTYLRDIVDIGRAYESPPRFVNTLSLVRQDGELEDARAVTVAVYMRRGGQIGTFEAEVQERLRSIERTLPEGLVLKRTSDQPQQVDESVHLFMSSLYEAIALVVAVALIGFWEWRAAGMLAVAIPITLAMTFGLMHLFGIDIQQVSIASLIIALGLLIDDPVVASDAIESSLSAGWRPVVAAWLGPTKLARAILFATVTNIAAYLPFLTLSGDVGKFIFSLPVVLTLSLVASRISR